MPRASERLKNRLLGPALPNEALAHERLGRPDRAGRVLLDALSSTAYATEEILRTLLSPAGIGVLAFSYVVPITLAMVVVLAILMFSYRQTIKAYPSAGGAYIVTKDNLGLLPAQVAGVALLTDYVLTVAVSVSAGVAALYSAVPARTRGGSRSPSASSPSSPGATCAASRSRARIFAAPTYGFIVSMLAIIIVGLVKALRPATSHRRSRRATRAPRCRRRRRPLPGPPRLRLGRRRHDRRRGDLQRRAGLQAAGVEERPLHADV